MGYWVLLTDHDELEDFHHVEEEDFNQLRSDCIRAGIEPDLQEVDSRRLRGHSMVYKRLLMSPRKAYTREHFEDNTGTTQADLVIRIP